MIISDVMTELGDQLDTIDGLRVYDYIADNAQVPAAVIGFPEEYTFDVTMQRGLDMITVPITAIVGKVDDRTSRDVLSLFVDGSGLKSFKQVLRGGTYTAFSSHRIASVRFEVITLAGVDYMSGTFSVDVWGSGGSTLFTESGERLLTESGDLLVQEV